MFDSEVKTHTKPRSRPEDTKKSEKSEKREQSSKSERSLKGNYKNNSFLNVAPCLSLFISEYRFIITISKTKQYRRKGEEKEKSRQGSWKRPFWSRQRTRQKSRKEKNQRRNKITFQE